MTTDITAAQATTQDQPATDKPFVAVGTDKDTGRAIIALDAAAVDILTGILDDLANSDDFMYSDDPDHAAHSAVVHGILTPLLKMQGFL